MLVALSVTPAKQGCAPVGRSEGVRGERMIEDRWLSVEEIAACFGVKRGTIYKLIERKHIPAHKV